MIFMAASVSGWIGSCHDNPNGGHPHGTVSESVQSRLYCGCVGRSPDSALNGALSTVDWAPKTSVFRLAI